MGFKSWKRRAGVERVESIVHSLISAEMVLSWRVCNMVCTLVWCARSIHVYPVRRKPICPVCLSAAYILLAAFFQTAPPSFARMAVQLELDAGKGEFKLDERALKLVYTPPASAGEVPPQASIQIMDKGKACDKISISSAVLLPPA